MKRNNNWDEITQYTYSKKQKINLNYNDIYFIYENSHFDNNIIYTRKKFSKKNFKKKRSKKCVKNKVIFSHPKSYFFFPKKNFII